jgi:hypothetical protein
MNMDAQDIERDDQQGGAPPDEARRESGLPGGGHGRIDETGTSGVYPVSEMEGAGGDAPVRGEMGWGQGERGAAGYYDSGSSEITMSDGTAIPGEGGADVSGSAGRTDEAASQPRDPTSPATDPLSGLV